jgi:hypothetical protein
MDCEKYQILYDRNWIDLYQYLGGSYISLDKWLHYFGIERHCCVKGGDVPRLYAQEKFAEIEEHAIDDVRVCEELVNRLRFETTKRIMSQNTKNPL